MPKLTEKAFTDTFLRSLKAPPARKDIYDTVQRGLGLRLAPSGTKTWFAMRRVDGSMKRITIGRYPDVKLAVARQKAGDLFEQIATVGAIIKPKAAPIFTTVLEDWLNRDQAAKKRKSTAEKRRALVRDVRPVLGNKPIDTITKQDIQRLLAGVVDRGTPIHANRLLAYLRRMFNWAVEQDIIAVSPANGIKKPANENSRDRTLTPTELGAIWEATEQIGQPFGPYIQTLILTGQRRNEVAGARWSEFDLEKREWMIPGERAKNGKAHHVHLSSTVSLSTEWHQSLKWFQLCVHDYRHHSDLGFLKG